MQFVMAAGLIPGCELDHVAIKDQWLTIKAHTNGKTAACPACTELSESVHSYYTRSPQDLPLGEQAVRLCLRVRRFRCLNQQCPKRTFAERLTLLLEPHAQKTARLVRALYHTAQALGSSAAARLLALLRMPTSLTTLPNMLAVYRMAHLRHGR